MLIFAPMVLSALTTMVHSVSRAISEEMPRELPMEKIQVPGSWLVYKINRLFIYPITMAIPVSIPL
jgi:hypothetical protein